MAKYNGGGEYEKRSVNRGQEGKYYTSNYYISIAELFIFKHFQKPKKNKIL